MPKPILLILAAGMGSRYGGLKQMESFGPAKEAIIEYSIYDAITAGFGKVVFVLKSEMVEDFKKIIISKIDNAIDTQIVIQDIGRVPEGIYFNAERTKPWGTAHAVLMAKEVINGPFLTINADDYYGREAYTLAAGFLEKISDIDNRYCSIGYLLKNTLSEYGSVARATLHIQHGLLRGTTEHTHIEKTAKGAAYKNEKGVFCDMDANELISMNMWGFGPSVFDQLEVGFKEFLQKNKNDLKAEYYIPDLINNLVQNNLARVSVLKTKSKWFGVTYREDREKVKMELLSLHEDGTYPSPLWKK